MVSDKEMKVGSVIANGAIVLAIRSHPKDGYVILADASKMNTKMYATWRCMYCDGHDTFFWHYFDDIVNAAQDFKTR